VILLVVSPLTPCYRNRGIWKVLRTSDASEKYCGTAISFVCFSLRAVDLEFETIPTCFTVLQRLALKRYREHLNTVHMVSTEGVELFQAALCSVLFREENMDIDCFGKLACPVQSYMALLALRSVGKFVPACLVTQPISRLMYISRNAAHRLTLDKVSKDGGGFFE